MAETTAELIQEGKDISVTLTDPERKRFVECEQIIQKGLNTFLEVGHALAEIRDQRLYRETHKDWAHYCKDIWDLTKRYADMQIQAHEAVALLESKREQLFPFFNVATSPACDETLAEMGEKCLACEHRKAMTNRAFTGIRIPWSHGKCTRPEGLCTDGPEEKEPASEQEIILPMNEAQTRPLTKLKPDDQVKAWGLVLQKLNENPKAKLTAALVGKTVKEVKGEVVQKRREAKQKKLESTDRLSNLFKRQCKVMEEIINEERNSNWKTTSRKEAVKWLNYLVTLAEEND